MSGGSYSYIYSRLSEECESRMYDAEMNDLITDLCKVLHDLEWWKSDDISEEQYRNTLMEFKTKWFKGNREERLKEYIDKQVGMVRSELYALIGEPYEAEPIVKHKAERRGHWIFKEPTENGEGRFECSECTKSDIHSLAIGVPYCWYCGAKMEEQA